MEIIRRIHTMRELSRQVRGRGLRVGFVPTMGFLHEGHLSLIRSVKAMSDVVVVSIFVNPIQFGPHDDFDLYPRDLTRDTDLCIAEGVEYLFTPDAHEIYPPGPRVLLDVGELGTRLEGASRPGHFQGAATVVLKLFQLVQPAVAAFGQKDAQQALIIRRMVEDLLLDVEIMVLPIVREEDGVAMSSRNVRLSVKQRIAARAIPRALEAARHVLAEGQKKPAEIVLAAREVLEAEELLQVDYVELVDQVQLQPLTEISERGLLTVAVFADDVRLIDNALIQDGTLVL